MRKFLPLLLFATKISFGQTIENYLSPAFPTNLIASDNGKTIAWVFNDKGSRNIYVAESPTFAAKKVTNYSGDDGIEISSLSFTPAGDQIVFVRGNAGNNSGETANPAFLQTSTARNIWMINKDGNALRQITRGGYYKLSPDGKVLATTYQGQIYTLSLTDSNAKDQKLFQSRGGQSQFRWSPDGSMLAFVSNRGDHSFIGIYDFKTKKADFVETSMDNDTYPVWSTDGKQLAYARIPNKHNALPFLAEREHNPWSIRVFDLASNKATELWKADKGRGSVLATDIPTEENLLWWAAGDQLIFPWEKDGWQHLYSLELSSKKVRLLTPGNGEIENVTLSSDKQNIYYTTNISDINRRHIWRLNVK